MRSVVLGVLIACACCRSDSSAMPDASSMLGATSCDGPSGSMRVLAIGELLGADSGNVYFSMIDGGLGAWPKAGGLAMELPFAPNLIGANAVVTGGALYVTRESPNRNAIDTYDLASGAMHTIDLSTSGDSAVSLASAPDGEVFAAGSHTIFRVAAGSTTAETVISSTSYVSAQLAAADDFVVAEFLTQTGTYEIDTYVPSTATLSKLATSTESLGHLTATNTEILDFHGRPSLGTMERRSRTDLSILASNAHPYDAVQIAPSASYIYSSGGVDSSTCEMGMGFVGVYGLSRVAKSDGAFEALDQSGVISVVIVDNNRIYYTQNTVSACCVGNGNMCPSPVDPPPPLVMCFIE